VLLTSVSMTREGHSTREIARLTGWSHVTIASDLQAVRNLTKPVKNLTAKSSRTGSKATKQRRTEVAEAAAAEGVTDAPTEQYRIIYADPPWDYGAHAQPDYQTEQRDHYPVMTERQQPDRQRPPARARTHTKLGALLAKVERAAGPGRGKKKDVRHPSFKDFLAKIELDKQSAITRQRIGAMPPGELEKALVRVLPRPARSSIAARSPEPHSAEAATCVRSCCPSPDTGPGRVRIPAPSARHQRASLASTLCLDRAADVVEVLLISMIVIE
jgi:hypothetical protein